MLLFEKSGSIVIVVSSANMTTQKPADATWVQRFEATDWNEFTDISVEEHRERMDGSDFGYVLCDFLQKQSEAAKPLQILPIQFLRKYIGRFDTLDDLRRRYRFDRASIHVVSTVPGYYPGRFGSQHLNPTCDQTWRILYGPQRVADVLHRLSEKPPAPLSNDGLQRNIIPAKPKPWLPHNVLSKSDRLVVQTTSFGAKWTSRHVDELVRQYMGCDDPNDNANDDSVGEMIERVDILWPSMKLLQGISEHHEKMSPNTGEGINHFVFLSSEEFNGSDLAVCSQMKMYETSDSAPIPLTLTPHIKTYARLLDGEKSKGSNHLAWVMLSSACFSRGAQGFTMKKNSGCEYKDERGYSNFELGVLFVSRLQGDPTTDRLYSSYPEPSCACTTPKNDESQSAMRQDDTKCRFRTSYDQHHISPTQTRLIFVKRLTFIRSQGIALHLECVCLLLVGNGQ